MCSCNARLRSILHSKRGNNFEKKIIHRTAFWDPLVFFVSWILATRYRSTITYKPHLAHPPQITVSQCELRMGSSLSLLDCCSKTLQHPNYHHHHRHRRCSHSISSSHHYCDTDTLQQLEPQQLLLVLVQPSSSFSANTRPRPNWINNVKRLDDNI